MFKVFLEDIYAAIAKVGSRPSLRFAPADNKINSKISLWVAMAYSRAVAFFHHNLIMTNQAEIYYLGLREDALARGGQYDDFLLP